VDRFVGEDGPGIRSTVFFKGCPLKCIWCHSPQTQLGNPQLFFIENRCLRCGACKDACPQKAQIITVSKRTIAWELCDDCGKCTEVCPSRAVQMIGTQIPTLGQITDHIKTGVEFNRESKQVIFDPKININFKPGMHNCKPMGKLKYSNDYSGWVDDELRVVFASDNCEGQPFSNDPNPLIFDFSPIPTIEGFYKVDYSGKQTFTPVSYYAFGGVCQSNSGEWPLAEYYPYVEVQMPFTTPIARPLKFKVRTKTIVVPMSE